MKTKQQQEALEYFKKSADKWKEKTDGLDQHSVNIIRQRNEFVKKIVSENKPIGSFLDVGCGTGELVCQIAKLEIEATGVDYAQEMIDLALKKVYEESISNAKFVCSSIFDLKMEQNSFDCISANGFIEYISHREIEIFFDIIAKTLTSGGSFVVGSRNRLFNLISMNKFTLKELESDSFDLLVKEAVKWNTANEIEEVLNVHPAPIQASETEHENTGIDVTTRFQYTPLQLIKMLRSRDFNFVEVCPVHIHGVTPSFKEKNSGVHTSIANLLQTYARQSNHLLTHASTFMLHVKKR